VLNSQGQTLPGWPIIAGGFTSESSPIVADVSGDGVPDILFGNEGGLLYGWTWTGQNVAGFPLTVNDFIRSVPTADDVDGDGSIDLVLMGWDQNLYIWDFAAPYNKAAAQWPMLKHDMQRSGLYGYRVDDATDVGPGTDPQPARIPAAAFLAQNIPNPFNPTTRIQYGVPAGNSASVRLVIYDTAGRQVRELVRGTEAPGVHSALWDGRDDSGRRVSSGIFYYRLLVAGQSMTRKLVLLK
jgi:FlgD Ig-like domain